MLKFSKLKKKAEELEKNKLSNTIEWTEPLDRTENPLMKGVRPGNFMPDDKFRLEEMSANCYKLYKFNFFSDLFEGVLVINKEELL